MFLLNIQTRGIILAKFCLRDWSQFRFFFCIKPPWYD